MVAGNRECLTHTEVCHYCLDNKAASQPEKQGPQLNTTNTLSFSVYWMSPNIVAAMWHCVGDRLTQCHSTLGVTLLPGMAPQGVTLFPGMVLGGHCANCCCCKRQLQRVFLQEAIRKDCATPFTVMNVALWVCLSLFQEIFTTYFNVDN